MAYVCGWVCLLSVCVCKCACFMQNTSMSTQPSCRHAQPARLRVWYPAHPLTTTSFPFPFPFFFPFSLPFPFPSPAPATVCARLASWHAQKRKTRKRVKDTSIMHMNTQNEATTERKQTKPNQTKPYQAQAQARVEPGPKLKHKLKRVKLSQTKPNKAKKFAENAVERASTSKQPKTPLLLHECVCVCVCVCINRCMCVCSA